MFDPRDSYSGMQYGAYPGGMGMMRPPFNPYAQQPSVMQPAGRCGARPRHGGDVPQRRLIR